MQAQQRGQAIMQTFFIYTIADNRLLGRVEARDWAAARIAGQAFGYHYKQIFAATQRLPS